MNEVRWAWSIQSSLSIPHGPFCRRSSAFSPCGGDLTVTLTLLPMILAWNAAFVGPLAHATATRAESPRAVPDPRSQARGPSRLPRDCDHGPGQPPGVEARATPRAPAARSRVLLRL